MASAPPALNTTSPPNITSPVTMTAAERLTEEGLKLDVTVWLVIFCIFTFFFIIIVASICMHWMEVRRYGIRGQFVMLPPGPVPGSVTVVTSNQPHTRLIDHYHLHACYGPSKKCDTNREVSRCFSFPFLSKQTSDDPQRTK